MRVPTIGSSPSNEVHHRCRCRCRWWVCLSVVVVVPLSGRLGWWGKRETDEKKKFVDVCVLDPACRPRAVRGMQARTPPRVRDPSTVRCGKCSLLRCRPRAFPLPFTASVTRNFQIRPRADTRLRIFNTDKLSQHGAGTPHNTRTPHNITYPPLGHNLVVK